MMLGVSVDVLAFLLCAIVILLSLILVELGSIGRRLKERFPTEKEEDSKWARADPAGHWEAHRNDKK
jgi:hypothetical protein